jgi:hypothetical protein
LKSTSLGARYLEPYWTAFEMHAKGRWVGREIAEVFSTEFIANSKFYPVFIYFCLYFS